MVGVVSNYIRDKNNILIPHDLCVITRMAYDKVDVIYVEILFSKIN